MSTHIQQEKYHELAFYTLALRDDFFIHQNIVDAFTAQTATKNTKPKALTFALVGLYLLIEHNFTGKQIQLFHVKMSQDKQMWPHIALPINPGQVSIDAVLDAQPGELRNKMIHIWCKAVWETYADSHIAISKLADYYLISK